MKNELSQSAVKEVVEMSISLFKHNEDAYNVALSMLNDVGKAAIVHPTGTGKSFIGFKLCEEHPNKTVCWLSPSEYIFNTQMENLKSAGGTLSDKVKFFTYAKLMLMSESDIKEIAPDFIILDEFHRCGAKMWGQGVKKLLDAYPQCPILGLSATSIRYLDNQRDMCDELFDGNIASEMTLGDAIVRGILNPPKYILSVFSYERDVERYRRRIANARNKSVREKAEADLEALRRALEMSDGLDEIFNKHMTDRTGKYIVFCSNIKHMEEMIAHVPDWFGKVDTAPHVYTAYSDDPETSKAFSSFKADDSNHLKLLFCVDMLNEGVHVEDVSGVILFRPTVSPIIYKQQIGRSLSASKATEPVIFDIVNNIENLYSIGTIEEEMRVAMTYYRFRGEESLIVNDRFSLVDEVRDCRELFEKLNDALTASWEQMYEVAVDYYNQHGNLEVPRRYKTPEGYSLGNWLSTQRKVKAGMQFGILSGDRISKLDAIGMVWEDRSERAWNNFFAEAKLYAEKNGHLDVDVNYITANGINLGRWIANLRNSRKNNIHRKYLTEERIAALDKLGMIWDVPDYIWHQNYDAAMKFYRKCGHLDVPSEYVTEDGIRLGAWIRNIRAVRKNSDVSCKVSQEQIRMLDSIGMQWDDSLTRKWKYGYSQAELYYKKHHNIDVPVSYVNENGFALGAWLSRHRNVDPKTGRTAIKVTKERKAKLDALGMLWDKTPSLWERRFALAEDFFKNNGHLKVPSDYKVADVDLGKWIGEQRQIYRGKRQGKNLSCEQIRCLEAIGMEWRNTYEVAWDNRFSTVKKHFEKYGQIPTDKNNIGWINAQRRKYHAGKLSAEQVLKLESIGVQWSVSDSWENGFSHAEEYYRQHRHLNVSWKYVCPDGYALGSWIRNQRVSHNRPTKNHYLTDKQIKRLETLGIVWNPSDVKWQEGYYHAQEYSKILKGQSWVSTYVSPDGYKTGQWLWGQERVSMKTGLVAERAAKLKAIGFEFEVDNSERV